MKVFSIFNNKQPFMRMFRRKQNNRGVMWASLISILLSTIAMYVTRGRKNFKAPSLRNLVGNMGTRSRGPLMNDAALVEFSDELISKTTQNK